MKSAVAMIVFSLTIGVVIHWLSGYGLTDWEWWVASMSILTTGWLYGAARGYEEKTK